MADHQCPHCGVSLLGEEIPEEHRRHTGHTHYAREIGIEVLGVYDGILFWQCPDCGGRWHRFPEGHWLRTRAERHIEMRFMRNDDTDGDDKR